MSWCLSSSAVSLPGTALQIRTRMPAFLRPALRRTGSLRAPESTPASDPAEQHTGLFCIRPSQGGSVVFTQTAGTLGDVSSCWLSQGPQSDSGFLNLFLLPCCERSKITLKEPFCRCPAYELVPGSQADPDTASSPAPLCARRLTCPRPTVVSWPPPLPPNPADCTPAPSQPIPAAYLSRTGWVLGPASISLANLSQSRVEQVSLA